MAEATAKMNLDASGVESGKDKAVDSLKKVIAENERLGGSVKKLNARMKEGDVDRRKMSRAMDGLAGDLGNVRNAGDLATRTMTRLGGLLRGGAAIGAIVGFGAAIRSSTLEVRKLDQEMRALERRGRWGAGVSSMGDLEGTVSSARERRDRETPSTSTGGLFGLESIGSYASIYKDLLAESAATIWTGSRPMTRDQRRRRAEEVRREGLDKIGEKHGMGVDALEKELSGDTRGAAIDRIRLDFAERRGKAIREQNNALLVQLKREEALVLAEKKREGELSGMERTLAVGDSMRAEAHARALAGGMHTEGVTRSQLTANIRGARDRTNIAARRAEMKPNDPDAAAALVIARNQEKVAVAELARFETELTRERRDQVRLADAEITAMEARMRGLERTASLVERTAKAEQDIRDAVRQGNTALAERIRQRTRLENLQDAVDDRIDPATGRVKTSSQLARERRERRRTQRTRTRARDRHLDNFGLTNTRRDMAGNVVSGIDPVTGERRTLSDEDRAAFNESGVLGASDADLAGMSPMERARHDFHSSRSSGASREIAEAAGRAEGSSGPSETVAAAVAELKSEMAGVKNILEQWNN